MKNILVDTDILIDYSKGYSQELENLLEQQEKGEVHLYVNPVITAEFLTDQNLKANEKMTRALAFLNLFGMKEISKKMGILAGEFLRNAKTSFLGDALIAATCIVAGLQLATGNKKHFSKIPELIVTEINYTPTLEI